MSFRGRGLLAVGLWALACPAAWAQFIPGHIFGVHYSNNFCETDAKDPPTPVDEEYIYEMDPETGTYRTFATIPRELCGVIRGGMAFSPDGKRLRVASLLLGLIWEFDAQGHRSVALGSVSPDEAGNGIAFDADGNFYLSNYPSEVLKFPAEGGPPIVLADRNDGVRRPSALSVSPNGVVYVAVQTPSVGGYSGAQLIRITPDGEVSVLDTYPPMPGRPNYIRTLVVDDLDRVYVATIVGGFTYRYTGGDPKSRELFPLQCGLGGVCPYTLTMSADRTKLIAMAEFPKVGISEIDPENGSFEIVVVPPREISACGLAIVPLRGDIDGDRDSDLNDLEEWVSCMRGPGTGVPMAKCDLADMDADGDVDLNDARFFLLGHSRFID